MNTPTAIFLGLALIAGSIYVGGSLKPVVSAAHAADDDDGKGPWIIRGHNEPLIIWKLNTKDGSLFACKSSGGCAKVEIK